MRVSVEKTVTHQDVEAGWWEVVWEARAGVGMHAQVVGDDER